MLFNDLYNALSKRHKDVVELKVGIFKTVILEYKLSRSDVFVAEDVIMVLNDLKKMDKNVYRVVTILYEDEIAEVKKLLKTYYANKKRA